MMRAKQQGVITFDGFAEAGEASEASMRKLGPAGHDREFTTTLMRKQLLSIL